MRSCSASSSNTRAMLRPGGAYSVSVIAASARCHECSAEFSDRDPSGSGVRRRIVFSLSASTRKASCRESRLSDTAEHFLELVRPGHFKLIVAAVFRRPVRPPPQKGRGMPEAIALHVVVLHLADALDSEGFPREILPGAPAALPPGHAGPAMAFGIRPRSPRVFLECVVPQRL